ncbi:TrbI/VirB10 family protein [Algicola sagamiensis]|uniref:TrbI/VirB10 family protein n=1 Tax=Algicola sagamiensis TaxID=163869 RepID=UPI0003746875|nr:TrbI/VirB10 family protein [Algicola sagamiensis]
MTDSAKTISRKQKLIAVLGLIGTVGFITLGLWISDPNRGKPSVLEQKRMKEQEVRKDYTRKGSSSDISHEERWIAKSEEEMTKYLTENKALKEDISLLQEQMKQLHATLKRNELTNNKAINAAPIINTSPVKGELPPPPNMNKGNIPVVEASNPQLTHESPGDRLARNMLPPAPSSSSRGGGTNATSIQVFDFDDAKSQGKSKGLNISNSLPSGAFGKIVLLSGADAPTGGEAKNNPVPILMRLVDHGTLPNFFTSEIKDCHVTGDMRGDLPSERGKIRLERMSCILVNGDIIDVKVKGWVNGEDGKEGFRGRVVEKSGALIARSFVAGTLSGMSANIVSQNQKVEQTALGNVTSVNPSKAFETGIAQGGSNSMEKLAEYYMERANEMYPIIEVAANRMGEVVLAEPIEFKRNIKGNMGGPQK